MQGGMGYWTCVLGVAKAPLCVAGRWVQAIWYPEVARQDRAPEWGSVGFRAVSPPMRIVCERDPRRPLHASAQSRVFVSLQLPCCLRGHATPRSRARRPPAPKPCPANAPRFA